MSRTYDLNDLSNKKNKKKNGVRLQNDKKRGRQLVFDSLGT